MKSTAPKAAKFARLALVAALAVTVPACATLERAGHVASAVYTSNQLVFKLAIDRAVNTFIYGGPDPIETAAALVVKAERLRARLDRGVVVDLETLAAEIRSEISLQHLNPIDRATIEELAANLELEFARQIQAGEIRADAPVLVKGALDRVIATASQAARVR